VDIVGAGLSHARRSDMVITLVDGLLHLLEDLIDVDQIILRADIAHGREMVRGSGMTTGAVTTRCNWNRSGHHLVLGQRTTGQDGKRQVLKSQQPLADGGVRVGIKLAALQIAEELVQGIVSTLFVLIRGMTRLGALAQSVIDVSIRGAGRLRGWVRLIILRSAMGVALTRDGVQGGLKVVGGRGRITLGGTAAKHHVRIPSTRLGRSDQDGVIGVGLDMFLEVLGTLEGLAAEITLVRFERDMHSNVRGDVIPLDGGGATAAPLARQVEVVGALATDMAFADVFLDGVSDVEMDTKDEGLT
jgi:hypothetical protein